jgi:hypothetical protein
VQNHFKNKETLYHNLIKPPFSDAFVNKTTIESVQYRNHYSFNKRNANNRFIPIAIPNTSARSQAAIAINSEKKNVIDNGE